MDLYLQFVDLYAVLVSIVAILIVPVIIYATWFAWRKVREFNRKESRSPVLMVILAIVSTMGLFATGWFSVLIAVDFQGGELPKVLSPLTYTAFLSLELIPIIIMGYLIWRDRHDTKQEEEE